MASAGDFRIIGIIKIKRFDYALRSKVISTSDFIHKVYSTVIPRNVRLSEAPSHGKPIALYDRASRGAEAYIALATEFLKQQMKGADHGS